MLFINKRKKKELLLKSNRHEIMTLIRKVGRYDLENGAIHQLDLVKMKLQHLPVMSDEVLMIEARIIKYLSMLLEIMSDSLTKVIEFYLETIINLLDERNNIKEDKGMLFKKKNPVEIAKNNHEEKNFELRQAILTYEAKVHTINTKMDALIEKGKRPDIKANSFEFDKLEREFSKLEDDLKTLEEVLEGLYDTMDENNKISNMEMIKEAIEISKKLRGRTFEEATDLANQVQLERNIAAEEKNKFKELAQQFKEGAPTKTTRQRSSFQDRIEERKVEDLKESVEHTIKVQELIREKEEV